MNISDKLKLYIKEKKTSAITRNKELLNELISLTNNLKKDSTTSERIYHLLGNTKPTCPNGNEYKWNNNLAKYETCANIAKCICAKENQAKNISEHYKNKSEKNKKITNIKRETTCKKKYGYSHVSKNDKIKEKIKKTNLERYGFTVSSKNKDVYEKSKQTNLKKYNTEYTMQNDKIKEKVKQTNLERYGTSSVLSNNKIKEKVKQTNLERYGVEYPIQNEIIKEKVKQTNLERYGVEIFSQKNYSQYDIKLMNDDIFLKEEFNKHGYDILVKSDILKYTLINRLYELKIIDKKPKSLLEKKIYNILLQCNLTEDDIIINDRNIIKPLELDFVIEKYKIAIEVCGLYWHSEKFLNNSYHKDKFTKCNEKGYRLITIFEDELINKENIVCDRLQYILKNKKIYIGARKTVIKNITDEQSKNFINEYHIQGNCGASIKLGAFYNDELVSVMTFGKTRVALGSNTESYELMRFCSKYNIPGIASKLFSYYIKNYNPDEVLTYCDLRWGTGNIYKILGFKEQAITKPNYWYFKDRTRRFHRYNFNKHSLIKKGFDKNLTEFKIMENEGWHRIYDCGNKKFIFKSKVK